MWSLCAYSYFESEGLRVLFRRSHQCLVLITLQASLKSCCTPPRTSSSRLPFRPSPGHTLCLAWTSLVLLRQDRARRLLSACLASITSALSSRRASIKVSDQQCYAALTASAASNVYIVSVQHDHLARLITNLSSAVLDPAYKSTPTRPTLSILEDPWTS